MTVVQRNGVTVGTYVYNALGQRVSKTVTAPAASTTRFAYDQNSQILAEYGATNRDIIWLGDLPIATVDGTGAAAKFGYIHVDALGTPRAVTDANGATIWAWEFQGNPFGESLPTSAGGGLLNLRSPGQYFDAESGLLFNQYRDYDPTTGRYLQSDPVGLAGGINSYAYVSSSPLRYVDPLGNKPGDPFSTPQAAAIDVLSYINPLSIRANLEYGGLIYEKNDCFYATEPAPGVGDHVKAFAEGLKRMPKDGDEIGDYHTHGPYAKHGADGKPVPVNSSAQDEYNSDQFSKQDMDNSKVANGLFPGWKSYLSTPSGVFRKYDPTTGKTSSMRRQ